MADDVIRHLMRVAHSWAAEPVAPEERSDTLEIELRKAFARRLEIGQPDRGGILVDLRVVEAAGVPADEIHFRGQDGRLLAKIVGIGPGAAGGGK